MSGPFSELLQSAFRTKPAHEANTAIAEVRAGVTKRFQTAVNYEVVLDGRTGKYLFEIVAPRLAFFLKSKRFSVLQSEPVFLSIFYSDTLYFVTAPDFYRYVQAAGGYSDAMFASLVSAWEQTGRGAVGALPTAEPPDA